MSVFAAHFHRDVLFVMEGCCVCWLRLARLYDEPLAGKVIRGGEAISWPHLQSSRGACEGAWQAEMRKVVLDG